MALTKVTGGILSQPIDLGITTATTGFFSGIVTAQSVRVLGDLTVDGSTTTLDTVVTEVDRLEVGANNTTVGVAITQSGTGNALTIDDGNTRVFTVKDGGSVRIGDNASYTPATGAEDLVVGALTGNNNGITIITGSGNQTGSLSFADSASGNPGALFYRHTDNTMLFRVAGGTRMSIKGASGGKVGIGTTNPTQALHIYSTSPVIRLTDIDTSVSAQINATNGNLYFDTTNSNRDVIFRGGSTEVARITGDGKVGIGTNIPDTFLHVYGSSATQKLITLAGGGTKRNNYIGIFQSDNLEISADEDNQGGDSSIRFRIDGSEQIRFASNGNVGINSTSPATKLDVRLGAAWIYPDDDGTEAIALKLGKLADFNSSLNDILVADNDGSSTPTYQVTNKFNRYIANWHFDRVTSPGATRINAFRLRSAIDGTNLGNKFTIRDLHNTADSVVLWSNGNSYVGVTTDGTSRNFGIGTNNPQAKLDIGGNTDGSIQAIMTRGMDSAFQLQFRNETSSNNPNTTAGMFGLFRNDVDIVGMQFRRGSGTGPGLLSFTTGGEEKVRITSGGNVGIGTDDPQAKLDVTAGAVNNAAFLKTGSDKSLIEFEHNAGTVFNTRIGSMTIGSGNVGLLFETGTSSDRLQAMVIDRYGKVGIGTNAAGTTLDVFGFFQVKDSTGKLSMQMDGANGQFKVFQSPASWNHLDFNPNPILAWDFKNGPGDLMYMASGGNTATASQMALVISDGHGFKVGRSGYDGTDFDVSPTAEYFRIATGGNVGIGTNSPQEILHIHNDGTGPCDVRISNNEGYGFLRSDSNLLAYNAQLHLFANRDRSVEYMRITNQGRVGIGTISPNDARLRVVHDGLDKVLQQWGGAQGSTAGQRFMELYSPATDSANDYFRFQTGNAFKFRIDSTDALCINYASNIGVGTDNPSQPLTLHRSSAGQSEFGLRFQFVNTSGPTQTSSALLVGSYGLKLKNYNSNRNFLFETGNVGIGTATPDQKLHVYNGAGNVTSFVEAIAGDALLNLSNSGNGNYSGINFIRERSTGTGINGGSIFMPSNTANNEAFLYIQAQSANAQAGQTGALTDNNGVRLKLHGDDGIFSIETGSLERIRITNEGRIGINDTSPNSYEVDLQNRSDSTGNDTQVRIYNNQTGSTNDTVIRNQIAGTTANNYIYFGDGDDTNVGQIRYNHNSNFMSFNVNAGEQIRINSDGDVGIGTNSPDAKTHIYRSSAGSVTAATDANDLVIESSTNVGMSLLTANDSQARIKFGDPDATNAGAFVYNHQNDKFSIVTATGNRMIIGSDMISARTHYGVARTVGGYTFRETNEGNERAGMHSNASNELIFKTGGAVEQLRIDGSGNVGIGTDDPTDILDINSDQASAVSDVYIRNHANLGGAALNLVTQGTYNSPTYKAIIGCSDAGGTIRMGAASDHPLLLLVNNAPKVTIQTSGKVGIGSENPQTQLDVVGDDGLMVRTTTNGGASGTGGVVIKMTDQTPSDNQAGFIKYRHVDGQSPGDNYGSAFFVTSETTNNAFVIGDFEHDNTGFNNDLLVKTNVGIGTHIISRGPLQIHKRNSDDVQIHMTNNETGVGSGNGFTIFGGAGTSGRDMGFVNRETTGAIEFYTNQGGTLTQRGAWHTGTNITTFCINTASNGNHSNFHVSNHDTTDYNGIADRTEYPIMTDIHFTGSDNPTANRTHAAWRNDVENSITTGSNTNGNRTQIYGIHSTVNSTKYSYILYGGYLFAASTADNATIAQTVIGSYGYAQGYINASSSNQGANIYGGHFIGYRGGSTQGGHCYGALGRAQQTTNGDGSKTGDMTGVLGEVEIDEGQISNGYSFRAIIDMDNNTSDGVSAASTITTAYLYHGTYSIASGTTVTNKRGIWLTGCTDNYLAGDLEITGTLEKGTNNFRIPHPLVGLTTTKDLVHSVIEGPQMDLIYRGKTDLVAGISTINIDTKAGMTEGTFVALCRDIQCFTSNETGWTNVKGSVTGNQLTIIAQDNTCTDTISWMVVGERQDDNAKSATCTDDDGNLIVEPDKKPAKDAVKYECEDNIHNTDPNHNPKDD